MHRHRAVLAFIGALLAACQAASPASIPPGPASAQPGPASAPAPTPAPTPLQSAAPGATATPAGSGETGIRWQQVGLGRDTGMLRVPLDYADPSGRQITLALARHRATDPGHRIGTLVYLDGGPGGTGTDTLRNYADALFPKAVLERFDIVAFDPRARGHSVPAIDCKLDPAPSTWDPTKGREMLPAWLATIKAEVADCAAASGDLLPHLGTRNTVADVEQIRLALGGERVSLYGSSYGTLVGSLYADRFPDHLRALVLNAPIDPAGNLEQKERTQLTGFQRELDAFLAACSGDTACPFWSKGESRRAYDALMARFEKGPIGDATAGEAMTGVTFGLYAEDRTALASALAEARDGDATALEAMARGFVDQDFLGYNAAVNCLDYAVPRDVGAWAAVEERLATVAPDFAWGWGWDPACIYWPVNPDPITEPVRAAGAPPILILASTGDPATPYEQAVSLAKQLTSSVLVTREGAGHGNGGPCIDRIIEDYLLRLEAPEPGTVCR